MPLSKPSTIALQAGHGFVTDLVGAYLLVENTGVTWADYSGRANHAFKIDGTTPAWTAAANNAIYQVKVSAARWGVNSSVSDFNHTNAQAWSIIAHFNRRGTSGGSYQRINARAANVVDFALKNTTFQPAFFTGAAWVDITGSSVSGTDEMWALTYDNGTIKTFRASAAGVTELDSRTSLLASTGSMFWTGNGGEDIFGDLYAFFYHRRALTINELATHYSAPFEAFTPPPPPDHSKFSPDNTNIPHGFTGLSGSGYYDTSAPSPSHLMDWLGGAR